MNLRVPMASPDIGEAEAKAVYEQVLSGWISSGARVKELEARIAEYTGCEHAIAMINGTATLHACLAALNVGVGDEVIVPSMSYISSANAVVYMGAKPIFVDVDPRTFNTNIEDVEAAVTSKTRAVMPVDMKGMPVDFDAYAKFSASSGIPMVADSAESFGAKYKGSIVGDQLDMHSFSFFANKNITMGEGGCVTTNNGDIAEILRKLRNQGQSSRYIHDRIGFNYRLTDVAASIGIEQLKKIDGIIARKNEIAARFDALFEAHSRITTPYVPEYCTQHSWYNYCIKLPTNAERDAVIDHLRSQGVDTRVSFPPIHLQPIYRELYGYEPGMLPVTEDLAACFVDIPCHAGMSEDDIDYVANCVGDALDG